MATSKSKDSLSSFRVSTAPAFPGPLKVLAPLFDQFIGFRGLQKLYEKACAPNTTSDVFCDRLIQEMKIEVVGTESLSAIPKQGPVVVVANHPCGGLEGIVLARELARLRPDSKILVNRFLGAIPELRARFILTNPLKPGDPENRKSINSCHRHLKQGGLLLVFPAGKVSSWQESTQSIADGPWSRLPALLAKKHKATLVPLFVDGQNSKFFQKLSGLSGQIRMLFLPRELLKQKGKSLGLYAGSGLQHAELQACGTPEKIMALARAATYALDPKSTTVLGAKNRMCVSLANPLPKSLLKRDVASLPAHQCLHSQSHYSVYFAYYPQIPSIVLEIARLREDVFRDFDEGSGHPRDADRFDKTYTHLFVYDHKENQVLGAYRMGQTDLLNSTDDLYLSQMFDFGKNFVNRRQPCLEMGRSFVAKNHHKNRYGLGLLWKGIGAFLKMNPQYSVLYGTVSLTSQFSALSLGLIQNSISFTAADVKAKQPFRPGLHPEAQKWLRQNTVPQDDLPHWVRILERGERDLPVLYRQYQKLGAEFYDIGLDNNFANTPGLLLSVNLSKTPTPILKRYIGMSYEDLQKDHQQTSDAQLQLSEAHI